MDEQSVANSSDTEMPEEMTSPNGGHWHFPVDDHNIDSGDTVPARLDNRLSIKYNIPVTHCKKLQILAVNQRIIAIWQRNKLSVI